MEVIVRTQDGMVYREFKFPLSVIKSNWEGYILCMGGTTFADHLGEYEEEKHAIHVMNYLLSRRNYYAYDEDANKRLKSIIINIPSDDLVKQTPDENLLTSVTKSEGKTND